MRSRPLLAVVLGLLPTLAAWPARLAAQDTSPAGRIAGMVRNTSNERAGGIGLALEGTGRTTITDSLGRFRFDSLMAGLFS